MRATLILSLVAALELVSRPAQAGQLYVDPIFGTSVTHDVEYGKAMNRQGQMETLLMDLYEPVGDSSTARPVFIFVHGGSLVGGDKARGSGDPVYMATEMARRGYVAASVNYRLLTQFIDGPSFIGALNPALRDGLLDAQHDVQASVRWFRANAATRGIDPTRIVVSGHSAGAGIALLVNYNSEDPGDSNDLHEPSNVAGAISHSGSLLEPSMVGQGEPPAMDIHALDDTTAPIVFTLATTLVPVKAMGNAFDMTIYTSGGHGLSGHLAERVGATVSFLCRTLVSCG